MLQPPLPGGGAVTAGVLKLATVEYALVTLPFVPNARQ
jgi:hypothetical protein